MNFCHWFIAICAAVSFSGCVERNTVSKTTDAAIGIPYGKVKFSPVKTAGLSLNILGRPVARAGRSGVITFALANDGAAKVDIPEWFRHESDNLGILIQPMLSGMTEPDEKKWVRLSFEFTKPVTHYPVTLMPGNKLLISKNVDFIKDMILPPGEERRFFFKGELTLESLPLSSRIGILRVTSNVEKR